MPSTIDANIRAHIESFTQELTELVKRAAIDSVHEALGGTPSGRPAKRGPGRPPSSKTAKRSSSRSGRRSPEQVEAMGIDILTYVKANRGQRLEEISAALQIPTKEMKRPVANLLEANKLRTKGQKRGTKYFAGGARTTKAKAKRKSKKGRSARA